jgi:tripartite-type tricarboxylate transporter receptor subunit TctC
MISPSDCWQSVAGSARLAPAVLERLNEALNRVQNLPTVRTSLINAGLVPVGGTPEAFARYLQAELVKWTKVAKDVGAVAN